MAVAKYAGNMRQTGIGIRELKKLVKIGDRFDYTVTHTAERVEVIELYPDLVKLKVIGTGKEMIVSFADILLYSNKKSLQPFKEDKL